MSKSRHRLLHWLTKCEKSSSEKGMVGFLIKKKVARSKTMANAELVCIATFFFTMSPLVFIMM